MENVRKNVTDRPRAQAWRATQPAPNARLARRDARALCTPRSHGAPGPTR